MGNREDLLAGAGVGQTVIPVIGFCVTGFFLAEELTAVALLRRGIRVTERKAAVNRGEAAVFQERDAPDRATIRRETRRRRAASETRSG